MNLFNISIPFLLLITFANSLDPDQARQNVGPAKQLLCRSL